MDDNLDYIGQSDSLGKNVGDDFAEGKVTLPIIVALRNGNPDQVGFLEEAVLEGGEQDLNMVLEIVRETGALDYTQKIAAKEKCKALSCLSAIPKSAFRDALEDLAEFSIKRTN